MNTFLLILCVLGAALFWLAAVCCIGWCLQRKPPHSWEEALEPPEPPPRKGVKTMREFCRERGTEWYFEKRLPPE